MKPYSIDGRIAALDYEARRNSSRKDDYLIDCRRENGSPFKDIMPKVSDVNASFVRAYVKARRSRDIFLDKDLFADPAWDILLDLTAARMENKSISVSSLLLAASVPYTTGLRWINVMLGAKLLQRRADPDDGRRHFIAISDKAFDATLSCLGRMRALITPSD